MFEDATSKVAALLFPARKALKPFSWGHRRLPPTTQIEGGARPSCLARATHPHASGFQGALMYEQADERDGIGLAHILTRTPV